MTLRTGTSKSNAFTLLELMLVMTLMVVVIAVAFPSLQRFFRGRNLESEGRRFLSLARYGQSRAVSEGIPMVLYVDPRKRIYGLEAETGYLDRDDKGVEYDVDEHLDLEVAQSQVNRAQLTDEQQYRRGKGAAKNQSNLEIHFSPDGTIDVLSLDSVCIRESKDPNHAIWINQSQNRLGYEVDNQPPIQRH